MAELTNRVEQLERDVSDIKVTLARIEGKLDNCVTWKNAFAGLSVLTLGMLAVIGTVIGAAWWMAQQYLSPLLQAAGAS